MCPGPGQPTDPVKQSLNLLVIQRGYLPFTGSSANALGVAGFEGVALKDGVRAKGNSLIPGGFYAQVGQDLTEGGEHNVEGGDISVYHSQQ